MRFFVPWILACAAVTAMACVHEEHHVVGPVLATEKRAPITPPAPPQYLLGDPSGTMTHILPLHAGAQGIVVDRRRVVVAHGEPRMATDEAPETIQGAMKLPARFGGGYLFHTESSIYRADAFDSALVPIAKTPDRIEAVSLGPKAIMVRTSNGERWGLGLPKGERVPLTPVGLVDVVALDEGRALGFDDRGAVFTSLDHGAHWTDATVQVKDKPSRVVMIGDELWLEDTQGSAMRLEPDGHLSWFDKLPDDPTTAELRPRDPKWRGSDFPLRQAIRMGVAIDEQTALVLEAGDVYRIDIHTGDVVSVTSGKLPPDATCEGMPIPGDALFACTSRSNQGSSFVVSHTLTGDGPIIEQTFGQPNLQFYASDDGALAYAGPCSATASPAIATACVRTPGGTWEEHDLSLITTDAGLGPNDVQVARWIPRSDGRVVAIVTDPTPGIFDPLTGTMTPVSDELKTLIGRSPPGIYNPGRGLPRVRYTKRSGGLYYFIDSSWSYVGTSIRGTTATGEAFEILEDGKIKRSPYDFEAIYSFNLGVGKSKEGRLYQTNDRGASWTEVATPPTGMESLDLLMCSSVGCDFGAFYRLGWQLRPPRVEPKMKPSPHPPEVRRVRGLELSCRASGPVVQKVLPRTESSPDDLGLGAVRLPTTSDKNDWSYVRVAYPRGIVSAWAGGDTGSGDGNDQPAALRMLLSGFATSKDDNDTLVASGPVKNVKALRRGVSYVPPFDPTGHVVRGGIAIADVVAAAKRAGMTEDEILGSDPTESGLPFPITPSDPNAPGDIAIHEPGTGLVAAFRGDRSRIAIRTANQNQSSPQAFSAVALPGDETAILEGENGGATSHVYKIGPNGMVDLFDFGLGNDGAPHIANPDALALGPKNELAILRTPSGSDPPSDLDPAYVVVQGGTPVQLAPWSTVKFADDPACKSEPGGHRATIQAIGPWIRVTNPDLKVEDYSMIARVRWTDKRVCLEGFEVKMPPVTIQAPSVGSTLSVSTTTWLVAKGSTFARVSVADGLEWRQPLECSVVSTGP